jgi:amino acid transporter
LSHPPPSDPKSQLRRVMGFWDVLLFNVAAVLGPRWIAAAAHNGTSSMSLWVLAAVLFFVPTAFVVVELSTRFPQEGGVYAWSKEAFGEFHGFLAGWTYWVYTFFYFPGLLMASAAMMAYIGGASAGHFAQERTFLLIGSLVLLMVAVVLNIVGLDIGKWLQNAGGVGTYVPMFMLIALGAYFSVTRGPATHFTVRNMMPVWNWDTVNFWPQIAFAFTGLELVATMSEEVRDPRRTFPRAIFGSGASIAALYILATFAVLAIQTPEGVDPKSGAFGALALGSAALGIGFFGVIAALLNAFGSAGGIGSTVAGVSRIPFVAGIDRYMPAAFGRIHAKWRTPWISILVQAGISCAILLLIQLDESAKSAYQILVDAATILYFIPFLYMYAAAIKLASRSDRNENTNAVLIPGGRLGVWIAGSLGFLVVLLGIFLSMIPPGESTNKWLFEGKLIGGTGLFVLIGLILYWRGARQKAASVSASPLR